MFYVLCLMFSVFRFECHRLVSFIVGHVCRLSGGCRHGRTVGVFAAQLARWCNSIASIVCQFVLLSLVCLVCRLSSVCYLTMSRVALVSGPHPQSGAAEAGFVGHRRPLGVEAEQNATHALLCLCMSLPPLPPRPSIHLTLHISIDAYFHLTVFGHFFDLQPIRMAIPRATRPIDSIPHARSGSFSSLSSHASPFSFPVVSPCCFFISNCLQLHVDRLLPLQRPPLPQHRLPCAVPRVCSPGWS